MHRGYANQICPSGWSPFFVSGTKEVDLIESFDLVVKMHAWSQLQNTNAVDLSHRMRKKRLEVTERLP